MDLIKLRKLTLKSNGDFFYQCGWDIEKLLENNPFQVAKAYYTLEKISFTDDILERLKQIFPNFLLIEKPGIADFNYRDLLFGEKNYDSMEYGELKRLIKWYKIKGLEVPYYLSCIYKARKTTNNLKKDTSGEIYKKSALQAKNHGR